MTYDPTKALWGYRLSLVTLTATTLLTVPEGSTWEGTIGAAVAAANTAGTTTQGAAVAAFNTGGGAIPLVSTFFDVKVLVAADVSGGTVGDQKSGRGKIKCKIAAVGSDALLQVTYTMSASSGRIHAYAIGVLKP